MLFFAHLAIGASLNLQNAIDTDSQLVLRVDTANIDQTLIGKITHNDLALCNHDFSAIYTVKSAKEIAIKPVKLLLTARYECSLNPKYFNADEHFVFETKNFGVQNTVYYPNGVFIVRFNDDIDPASIKNAYVLEKIEKLQKNPIPTSYEVYGNRLIITIASKDKPQNMQLRIHNTLLNTDQVAMADTYEYAVGRKTGNYTQNNAKATLLIPIAPVAIPNDKGGISIRLYMSQYLYSSLCNYVSIPNVDNLECSSVQYVPYEDQQKYGDDISYYYEITGDIKPNTSYKLTIKKGLESYNKQLKADYNATVKTKDLGQTVAFESDKSYLSTSGEIGVKSMNVSRVNVVVDRMLSDNYRYFVSIASGMKDTIDGLSKEAASKQFDLDIQKNQWTQNKISLNDVFKENPSGIYKITVYYGKNRSASKYVILTNIALSAKVSKNEVFVFATSLDEGKALKNVRIKLYAKNNLPLGEAQTNAQGVAMIKADNLLMQNPTGIIATLDKDTGFLNLSRPINSSAYISAIAHENSNVKGYIYMPSKIVRPGDIAYFTGILKDTNYQAVADMPVEMRILDTNGQLVDKKALKTNAKGMFDYNLTTLPSYKTGMYIAQLKMGDRQIGEEYFSLEDFVPQRIANTISNLNRAYYPEDTMELLLHSEYLFGGPAANLNGTMRITAIKDSFSDPKFKNYRFDNILQKDSVTNYIDTTVNFTLDDNGSVWQTRSLTLNAMPPSILSGMVEMTVNDDGRDVSKYANFKIYPYPRMVGLKLNSTYLDENTPLEAKSIIVDMKTFETIDANLSATIYRYSWHYAYDTSRGYNAWQKELIPVKTFTLSSKDAIKEPLEAGDYVLSVSDYLGGHSASVSFHVSGWDYVSIDPTDDFAKNQVKFEDKPYKKGDTLKLNIKSPIKNPALLVTLEGKNVFYHEVHQLKGNSASIAIDLDFDLTDGFYVKTAAIGSTKNASAMTPYRAISSDYVTIDKSRYDNKPKMTIQSAFRSHSALDIDIQAKPKSDVIISVVDMGILNIISQKAPDPFDFFNVKLGELIAYYDIYNDVIQYVTNGKLLKFGGGDLAEAQMLAMQKNLAPDRQSKRIKPFVYHSGILHADENGRLHHALEIPEFNGKARISAIAVSDRAIGSDTQEVVIKDDIIIKPTFPLFGIEGDDLRIPIRIFNNTDKAKTIVMESTSSIHLTLHMQQETLKIPPHSSQLVYAYMQVKNEGDAALTLYAKDASSVYTSTLELPVYTTQSLQNIVYNGTTDQETEIELDKSYFTASPARLDVALSSLPFAKFKQPLLNAIRYPYGCTEQLSTQALSMNLSKYFIQSMDAANKESLTKDKDRFIQTIIMKLANRQKAHNGQFGYWDETGGVNAFASVYASDVLLQLKHDGYDVPRYVLDGIQRGLNLLVKTNEKSVDHKTRLYAAYLLAKHYTLSVTTSNYLYDKKLYTDSIADMYLMAAILKAQNHIAALNDVMGQIRRYNIAAMSSKNDWDLSFYNKDRDIAMALYIHAQNFSKDATSQKLLESVVNNNADNLYSTQNIAFTLRAISAYFGDIPDSKLDATITYDGKQKSVQTASNFVDTIAANHIAIQPNNHTTNYQVTVSAYKDVAPKHIEGIADEKDVSIFREFVHADGSKVDIDTLHSNMLVYSKLTIKNRRSLANMAIAERIGSCMSIVNERIEGTRRTEQTQNKNTHIAYQDIRDDRVLTFVDLKGNDRNVTTTTLYTPIKIETKGHCMLPAVTIEAMYDNRIGDYDLERSSIEVR